MQIPEKVRWILDRLEENGFEGYAVGGCVRDSMMGREPGDWDITTSAKPDEVKRIFQRTIDTGIAHGTVTVMIGGDGFEVTSYRVDGEYKDHRHPKQVAFTPNLEKDLMRRDFTINAMAYNPKTGIVDLFDGMKDIERKCIRCVGNPVERFSEDALRMLRGVRFAGQLGFEIEDETLRAIRTCSHTITNVSAERIRVELTKLLMSEQPEKLLLAEKTGLCQSFFPELTTMLHTEQRNPHHCYNVGIHSIQTVKHVQRLCSQLKEAHKMECCLSPYAGGFPEEKVDIILVFAAMLHDVGKTVCKTNGPDGVDHFYGHDAKGSGMAEDILKRLRFDNDTIRIVTDVIRFHERRYDGKRGTIRRLVSKAGVEVMPYLFLIQEADVWSQSEYDREEKLARITEGRQMFSDICSEKEPVGIRDLAVTGKDIVGLGLSPGPEIGRMLRMLLEIVIEDPSQNDRKLLLTEAAKHIKIENECSCRE